MQKFCKAVRVATVAPFMAAALCLWLYFSDSSVITRGQDLAAAMLCLSVLPLLSYPIQPLIPYFRDLGRKGQRDLAMVFCAAGYALGLAYSFLAHAGRGMQGLFLTYFLSGGLMLLINGVFHVKASGHACGVAGPCTFLFAVIGMSALWVLPVYLVSGACSVWMKRHTVREWLLGSLISPAALGLAYLILGSFA